MTALTLMGLDTAPLLRGTRRSPALRPVLLVVSSPRRFVLTVISSVLALARTSSLSSSVHARRAECAGDVRAGVLVPLSRLLTGAEVHIASARRAASAPVPIPFSASSQHSQVAFRFVSSPMTFTTSLRAVVGLGPVTMLALTLVPRSMLMRLATSPSVESVLMTSSGLLALAMMVMPHATKFQRRHVTKSTRW